MNILKQFSSKTSLIIKIIVPIFILGLISTYISTQIIEDKLIKYIQESNENELKNINNKLYFFIESDFRTLFFSIGNDKERYEQAKEISKKETISNLKIMLKKSHYEACLINTQGEIIWLKKEIVTIEDIKKFNIPKIHYTAENKKFILYSSYFNPWEWKILIFKDKSAYLELIKENKEIIIFIISTLTFLTIILLLIVLSVTIYKPFSTVFEHLKSIKEGRFFDLKLFSSREIVKLVEHINSMSRKILANQKELIEQKNQTQLILDSQLSIVLVTNGEEILSVNKSFFDFFDKYNDIEEFLQEHKCVCDFFEKSDEYGYIYGYTNDKWIEAIYSKKCQAKVKIMKKSREYIFKIMVNKFLNDGSDSFVVTMTDITTLEIYKRELERRSDTLARKLYTDSLTLLPNRVKLIKDLEIAKIPSIILINIDSFKEINDFYGVNIGDFVLIEFAKTIRELLPRVTSTIYRVSGDEYAIYNNSFINRRDFLYIIRELSTQLQNTNFQKDDYEISFSSTVGAAIGKDNLLTNADIALKTAKKEKKRYLLYDDSLKTLKQYESNILWSKKIKNAIKDDKIVPYFQPIVSNTTGKIAKYECLVRLIDENLKVVVPYVFLKIAKKSHLYHKISEIMIQKSFEYFKDNDETFSINVSVDDIKNEETYSYIITMLKKYNIGNRVIFELLESEGIDNYSVVSEFINDVKNYGAKIAIDDFGTGYSNFNHIIQLKIDFIKIDGSLIRHMLIDENSRFVVETIVDFTKKLNLKTIAEFVDSKELYAKIKEMGIDYSQGYIISEPIPDVLPKDFPVTI